MDIDAEVETVHIAAPVPASLSTSQSLQRLAITRVASPSHAAPIDEDDGELQTGDEMLIGRVQNDQRTRLSISNTTSVESSDINAMLRH